MIPELPVLCAAIDGTFAEDLSAYLCAAANLAPDLARSWLQMRAALEGIAEEGCEEVNYDRNERGMGPFRACPERHKPEDWCPACRARAALAGRAGEGEG